MSYAGAAARSEAFSDDEATECLQAPDGGAVFGEELIDEALLLTDDAPEARLPVDGEDVVKRLRGHGPADDIHRAQVRIEVNGHASQRQRLVVINVLDHKFIEWILVVHVGQVSVCSSFQKENCQPKKYTPELGICMQYEVT